MMRIAVFPNRDKEDAPNVLARIFRFFRDKDVRLMTSQEDAAFFHCEEYGLSLIHI